MNTKTVTGLLLIGMVFSLLLSSCCSFPYRINTRQVAKVERAEVHAKKAEIVSIDGQMVSINKILWLFPAHAVITKGKHDIVVNYWERSVISKSPKN